MAETQLFEENITLEVLHPPTCAENQATEAESSWQVCDVCQRCL